MSENKAALKSRVLCTRDIKWMDLKFLQADSFKEVSDATKLKLKESILSNSFSQPFYVWENPLTGDVFCLDGKHRSGILKSLVQEGYHVPESLPATFMYCENESEAAMLVLQYSSIYATVTEQGLFDFIESFDLSLDDVMSQFELPEVDMLEMQSMFNSSEGVDSITPMSLSEKFLVPPFSILDTRQGYWQERKRIWNSLGFDSQETREDIELVAKSGQSPAIYELRNKMREVTGKDPSWDEILIEAEKRGLHVYGGASIFDPVLCEVIYTWFCTEQAVIIDPFAGGSVRGMVASFLGHHYTGIDLRGDQVEANIQQAIRLLPADKNHINWIAGDSLQMDELLPNEFKADFLFSCPPYHDLEHYSDNPADLSNMDYEEFLKIYKEIISRGVAKLKDNRFACFVVGDIRDKAGAYRNFVGDTVEAFRSAGMMYYNEITLINVAGSLPIRIGKQFEGYRKVGKMHQNVLVFYKGDPKKIKVEFPKIKVEELLINTKDEPNIALPIEIQ